MKVNRSSARRSPSRKQDEAKTELKQKAFYFLNLNLFRVETQETVVYNM